METVIGKKMKFRARDPLSALTHFIGFLAVIPPVICLLQRHRWFPLPLFPIVPAGR